MEEVFINVKDSVFENLFKQDIVSISDLVAELEELMFENENLKQELKDKEENYYEMEER